MTGPRRRLLALDGLRGLAAVAIVVHHAWMFDHGDSHVATMSLMDRGLDELRLGVTLFFVLSGYLVFGPFVAAALDGRDQPSRRRYALKRAARILPAYWLALAGAFALTAATHHPMGVSGAQLPLFLVFAQNQVAATNGHVDPPMWSLCVEVMFYAALPLLALAVARLGTDRRRQLALIAAVFAAGVLACVVTDLAGSPRTVTDSLLTCVPLFAAGMGVAVLTHGRTLSARAAVALIAAGVVLVVAGATVESAAALEAGPLRLAVSDTPAAIGFALIVAALVAAPLRARALTLRPVLFAGAISYGLYLWHFPVIYGLREAGAWPSQLVPAMALTLALAAVLASASWYLVERPILDAAHRRTNLKKRLSSSSPVRSWSTSAKPSSSNFEKKSSQETSSSRASGSLKSKRRTPGSPPDSVSVTVAGRAPRSSAQRRISS